MLVLRVLAVRGRSVGTGHGGTAGGLGTAHRGATEPATVLSPPTITANSADSSSRRMYGLMSRGASVWPTKMFAAALTDS